MVATNDNWKFDREKVLDTGIPPGDEHECAIVTTLKPGNYTAILRGLGSTTGVALFELYDLDPPSSRIANISTRGNVGTGEKSTQQQAIQNSGYAPPKDEEAAILTTLQPGNYNAIVRGKNNTTGVALVEVYNLDAN